MTSLLLRVTMPIFCLKIMYVEKRGLMVSLEGFGHSMQVIFSPKLVPVPLIKFPNRVEHFSTKILGRHVATSHSDIILYLLTLSEKCLWIRTSESDHNITNVCNENDW